MTITTSRGKTFPADWAWGPVGPRQELRMAIIDPRPLSEIAADFEGCERFRRQSDTEGDLDFDGYTRLTGAMRQPSGSVQLILARPEGS